MDKIQRQILVNQLKIMKYLWTTETAKIPMMEDGLYKQIQSTMNILDKKQEDICYDKEEFVKPMLSEGDKE
jgi:uncharacterized protein YfbU (UPF0304 family)